MTALTRDVPIWDVVVDEHDCPVGTSRMIHVPRLEVRTGGRGKTAETAKLQVLRWGLLDAGVPPLKSCIRASWRFVSVKRYVEEVVRL